MADQNAMQPPGGGNRPKMGKGLVIGIIVAILIVLALILFWPRGSNDVEQTTPGTGETDSLDFGAELETGGTDTFDTGTDLNTGVGTEGNVPPANEGVFPDVNDGLNVEF